MRTAEEYMAIVQTLLVSSTWQWRRPFKWVNIMHVGLYITAGRFGSGDWRQVCFRFYRHQASAVGLLADVVVSV